MLDWLKKEENGTGTTDSTSGKEDSGYLAVIFNKKISRTINNVPCVIGRTGGEADVTFYHESVALEHCRLDCSNRQFTITDLGSKAGTQVNGQKLNPGEPFPVDNNDKLTIGKVKMDITINYEELAIRERAAMEAARAKQPVEKTHIISVREVNRFEYDDSDVVYIDCGLEQPKKKGSYTQEINLKAIQDALKASGGGAGSYPSPPSPQPEPRPSAPPAAPEPQQLATPAAPARQPYVPQQQEDPGRVIFPVPAAPERERVLCLASLDEMGNPEQLTIDHFPFKIGRSKVNDYILKIDKISREHIVIIKKEGEHYVVDLNSTNGVKVNGITIRPDVEYKIKEGDIIKLSHKEFSVVLI